MVIEHPLHIALTESRISKARQTGVGLVSSGSTFQDQSRDAHSTLISTAPRDQGDSEFYGTAIGKV
jgi:hypothetical protein